MSAPSAEDAAIAVPVPAISAAPGRQRRADRAFQVALHLATWSGLIVLAVLVADIVLDGWGQLSLSFATDLPSQVPELAGIGPALMGTLWLMGVCLLFIVPVGVASAIYLEEYADSRRWYNRMIEVNIQNLAAIPSIIYGILGLAFLVRGPLDLGRVILAGGLTLGLLVLPVVIIAGREAIRAVPPSIREGSLALGATKWQTVWRQVLPAAIPGIATGTILALARAIGETAPLIVVGAFTFVSFYPNSFNSEFTALPIQIFNWITAPQDEFKLKAASAILVLLAVLIVMNAIAIWLRNRYEKKW